MKARGEIGTGATKNATGYPLSDGKKYYNFFNIGAYGGGDPNYNGILYAQSKGWDTTYKALLGGAWFIFRNYIEDGQDTTFLQRFNFTPCIPIATSTPRTSPTPTSGAAGRLMRPTPKTV
ncbi:MAG: hypothetical protein ACLUNQ_01075 [Oscillospiraceae bacterium]